MKIMDLVSDKQKASGKSASSQDLAGKLFLPLVVFLFAILTAVVFYFLLPKLAPSGLSLNSPTSGNSGYQAVFLTNGQVFFGRLSSSYSTEPILREVYYLKVGTVLEAAPKETKIEIKESKAGKEASSAAAKVTLAPTPAPLTRTSLDLVKLGEEIYGPDDTMRLNRQQILYVEELRTDSKVAQAIKLYHDNLKR